MSNLQDFIIKNEINSLFLMALPSFAIIITFDLEDQNIL